MESKTTKAAHTPGPWGVCNYKYRKKGQDYQRTAVKEVAGNHYITTEICGHNHGGSMDANAYLIAASPELLEACRELLKHDDDHDCRICSKQEWDIEKHDSWCPFRKAYAAIAKAEGKE